MSTQTRKPRLRIRSVKFDDETWSLITRLSHREALKTGERVTPSSIVRELVHDGLYGDRQLSLAMRAASKAQANQENGQGVAVDVAGEEGSELGAGMPFAHRST